MTDRKEDHLQTPSSDAAPARRSPLRTMRAVQARFVDQVGDVEGRLDKARARSATVDSAVRALAHDSETGGGVLAAAVAFRIFLFLIPYIFVIVVTFDVAALVLDESPHSVARRAGIGGLIAQAISASAAHLSGWSRVFALLGGLVAIFLAGRMLLKTLRIAHALVWGVGIPRKAHVARPVLTLIVVISAAMVLNIGVSRIRDASVLAGLGVTVLYVAIPFCVWLVLSTSMPHAAEAGWRALLPGAILFGFSFIGLHLFTVYWITHLIARRSATYGAVGAALALLLWAYVVGRMMMASAVLNASRWRRAEERQQTLDP